MLFAVDKSVLQHLSITGEDVFAVHSPQKDGVEDDGAGIVEHADLVLQASEVDARLATHGGIDHRQQCRGDVDVVESALKRGSRKAAEVGHHAAAEVHHQRVTGGAALL